MQFNVVHANSTYVDDKIDIVYFICMDRYTYKKSRKKTSIDVALESR